MPKSISFLRALFLLWAILVCPLALALLKSHATAQGLIFGLAALCFGVAPILLSFHVDWSGFRRTGMVALGIWLVLSIWLLWMRPDGAAPSDAAVTNRFVAGKNHYNNKALGAILPEVDQLTLGLQLMPLGFASFTHREAGELSPLLRSVYAQVEAARDFHALGSALPEAYDDFWGRSFERGHYYLYVPPKLDPHKRVPALVFLHGYGGNFKAYTWILSHVADELGMVLISPSFGIGKWEPKHGPGAVLAALDDAATVAPIDLDQVHLAGLSNGGLGAGQIIATDASKRFRSLVLLSPIIDLSLLEGFGIARWRPKPICVITGRLDDRALLTNVEKAVNSMKEGGLPTELKVYDDADHFLFFSERESVTQVITDFLRDQVHPENAPLAKPDKSATTGQAPSTAK